MENIVSWSFSGALSITKFCCELIGYACLSSSKLSYKQLSLLLGSEFSRERIVPLKTTEYELLIANFEIALTN